MLEQLELTLKRKALQYIAGRTIFCPACQNILDCRKTVEIEVHKDGQLMTSKAVCAVCYDRNNADHAVEQAFLDKGFTVVINDGRVLFARPKKSKAPKRMKTGLCFKTEVSL